MNVQLRAQLASGNSLRHPAEDVSKLPKFLSVLSVLRQKQQFVVPIDVQVIFVIGLVSRQNKSAFVRLDDGSRYSVSRPFSWFACDAKGGMTYS